MSNYSMIDMLKRSHSDQPLRMFKAGKAVMGAATPISVQDKWTGQEKYQVSAASEADLQEAIVQGCLAEKPMAELRAYERQDVLKQVVEELTACSDLLTRCLIWEAGKTLTDARAEVQRLMDTFTYAMAESVRMTGEQLELEVVPRARGYYGTTRYLPKGLCSFITPFNFPLNLLAHKVAPALAVGCPFIVKPASLTPVSSLLIAEVLSHCELPQGAFSVLPMPRASAQAMVEDKAFKMLSFTGSDQVGWDIKAKAGQKPVTLELGGNAPCLLFEDANLDSALPRILHGAYYQAGQSCISVQRILVHKRLYEQVKEGLLSRLKDLVYHQADTEKAFLSPMIAAKETHRVETWIADAVEKGATLLYGGKPLEQNTRVLMPALLEQVPLNHPLWTEEVFGPVAVLVPFESDQQAFELANRSRFALQAGLFTDKASRIEQAWRDIHGGGIVVNDVPSWRVDHMPYGGVNASGLGREGIRYAMLEMSEIKLKVQRFDTH
jgi:acyl-CoA reductase-like NAD-dependent aldehyde dehydrogenase